LFAGTATGGCATGAGVGVSDDGSVRRIYGDETGEDIGTLTILFVSEPLVWAITSARAAADGDKRARRKNSMGIIVAILIFDL